MQKKIGENKTEKEVIECDKKLVGVEKRGDSSLVEVKDQGDRSQIVRRKAKIEEKEDFYWMIKRNYFTNPSGSSVISARPFSVIIFPLLSISTR